MPNIDFSSAYRDATKGSTLKALAARRAEMQAALATARPREVKSPEQAIASVAETISGSIREGRLANQEAAGRQRFAELLKGGLAPDEIGEAYGLDTETTQKWMDRTWAQEDTKAAKDEAERVALRGHGWDVEGRTAEVQAAKDAAKLQADAKLAAEKAARTGAIEDREDAQRADEAAAAATAEINKQAAATEVTTGRETKKLESEAEIAEIGQKTEARKAEWLKLNPAGDINSPEAQSYILRDAAEPSGGFGGPAGIKAMQDFQHEGNIYTTGLNDINEAKALVPQALTGDIGRKVAELASSGGEMGIAAAVAAANSGLAGSLGIPPGLTREQIQATVRLYQIMDNVATTRMSGTLKGQTSNLEMEKFTRIFANPGATPEAKLQALASLEQAFKTDRDAVSATIQSAGGQALTPYEYRPVAVDGGMNPPADTAAPAGGGTTAAPAAPAAGVVEDGYEFLGGDPKDQKNWRPVATR